MERNVVGGFPMSAMPKQVNEPIPILGALVSFSVCGECECTGECARGQFNIFGAVEENGSTENTVVGRRGFSE